LSRDAIAALANALPAPLLLPVRAAVSVLLDDDDLVQAGRRAPEQGSESILDPSSDLCPLREVAVPHLVPAVDVEHDSRLCRFHVYLARRECARRLRNRTAAFPQRQGRRHGDISRL